MTHEMTTCLGEGSVLEGRWGLEPPSMPWLDSSNFRDRNVRPLKSSEAGGGGSPGRITVELKL